MNDRFKIMENELKKKNWNLFVSVYETTDRFQHMFYRLIDPEHPLYDAGLAGKYGDAIRDSYVRCDTIVAKAMEFVQEHTTLMIVSDHGFHSFRRGVNLNTWLVLNG
jgi:predicted AlkP superfamily phosphohydrolase/phosphomutase